MKISLENEIWSRLYGPYGNRSVNNLLTALSQKWDSALAKELYWEELHHQDDIFPVTFAALPWLIDLYPSSGEGLEQTLLFVSHIIHCACVEGGTGCDGAGPRGKYRGLSTRVADHHHSWIPQNEWLNTADEPILVALETWFSDHSAEMAENCLQLIGSDHYTSAYALEGFATVNGSTRLAWSTQMFASGEDVDFILQELGEYDERDSNVVGYLYPYIHQRDSELTSFILDYPGCTFDPSDPRQRRLF